MQALTPTLAILDEGGIYYFNHDWIQIGDIRSHLTLIYYDNRILQYYKDR